MKYNLKKSRVVFLAVWVLTLAAFWINSDSFYFSILIIPLTTVGIAVAIGFGDCGIGEVVTAALTVGVLYMLWDYLTLKLSNMLFNRYARFNMPDIEYFLFGATLFLIGFIAGVIARAFKRR